MEYDARHKLTLLTKGRAVAAGHWGTTAAAALACGSAGALTYAALHSVVAVPAAVAIALGASVAVGLLRHAGRKTRHARPHPALDYREVFEGNASPILVYAADDLTILDANPAAEAFFGWSRQELVSRSLDVLWPAHLQQVLRMEADEILAQPNQYHLLSTSLQLRDGSIRQVELRGNAISHGGRPARLLTAMDRSGELRAQQLQQQALSQLEEAHRIARIGTWQMDLSSGLVLFSDQVYQLLGRQPPGAQRWRSFQEVLVYGDESSNADVERAIGRLAKGQVRNINLLLPLMIMGSRQITVHLRAHRDGGADIGGQHVRIVGTLQDVTEQEASRRLLREREEQFRELVRVLPDGVIILSADVVLYANATGAEQFGSSRELMLGTSIAELVASSDLPLVSALLRSAAQPRDPHLGPAVCMRRSDGTQFSAAVAVANVRYGGRDCQLLVVRDLTELERHRQALARTNRELQTIAGRLFSLQEDERRAISRDLHDDIGQSITAMKLSAHAALDETDPQRRLADLQQISTLADSTIIKLRNLSMLLRPPQLDALGLEAALRWQAGMLFRSSPAELTVDIEPLPRRPAPDIEQACFRIAQESLTNALRHSAARHVILTLEEHDDAHLHLQVFDDGNGFDPDGPRGLGLLVMRERAQACGGALEIRSTPGAGVRIDLILPYHIHLPSPIAAAGT